MSIEHIDAKVICDSVNPVNNKRLTTFQIRVPRIILAEYNTHKCLIGQTVLHFDMPSSKTKGKTAIEKITLEEFWDKWENGSKEGKVPSFKEFDFSKIDEDTIYTAKDIENIYGLVHTAVNNACRFGELKATKGADGRTWLFTGSDFIEYRNNMGRRRFSIRSRLMEMNLRCYDSKNNKLSHTHIIDCWKVGDCPVFEVKAGDYSITGTRDHKVMTTDGWKEIQDIEVGDKIIVLTDKNPNKPPYYKSSTEKIDGKYVAQWNREVKPTVIERQGGVCAECGEAVDRFDIHHVIPKYICPERAFDIDNVVALCKKCHAEVHRRIGRINDVRHKKVTPKAIEVEAIIPRGIQTVYDITVDSEEHNFLANSIVTHNCICKNFASSRAIPARILRNEANHDPFIPVYWGKAQSGMSADEELTGWRKSVAKFLWLSASKCAVVHHWLMEKVGLHKQICNRVIEPWLSVTGVTTASEWDNFFKLRCSPMAQPEMRKLAEKMRDAMNASVPRELTINEPHLPFIDEEERKKFSLDEQIKVSVARCCRTSYNNMLGKKSQPEEDVKLFERATSHEHWSPCEHQGFVPKEGRITKDKQYDLQRGFRGFYQLRSFLDNTNNTHYLKDWYGVEIKSKKENE